MDFGLRIDQMYRLSCQQLFMKVGTAKALWIFNAQILLEYKLASVIF